MTTDTNTNETIEELYARTFGGLQHAVDTRRISALQAEAFRNMHPSSPQVAAIVWPDAPSTTVLDLYRNETRRLKARYAEEVTRHQEVLQNVASSIMESSELDALGACREGRISFIEEEIGGDYVPTVEHVVIGTVTFRGQDPEAFEAGHWDDSEGSNQGTYESGDFYDWEAPEGGVNVNALSAVLRYLVQSSELVSTFQRASSEGVSANELNRQIVRARTIVLPGDVR